MSDNQNFGFSKFVPGFDFLQNLTKGASQTLPQMPNLSSWIAPTLNLEELEKRISELKAVNFWLDQNSKALGATIQALEVQKMTLATLKGMNFKMGEVANALKLKPVDSAFSSAQKDSEKAQPASTAATRPSRRKTAKGGGKQTGVVDPVQWWGALTQQFQEIAATAMKDPTTQTAVDNAKNMATSVAKGAMETATEMANAVTGAAVSKPRKTAAKRAARQKA